MTWYLFKKNSRITTKTISIFYMEIWKLWKVNDRLKKIHPHLSGSNLYLIKTFQIALDVSAKPIPSNILNECSLLAFCDTSCQHQSHLNFFFLFTIMCINNFFHRWCLRQTFPLTYESPWISQCIALGHHQEPVFHSIPLDHQQAPAFHIQSERLAAKRLVLSSDWLHPTPRTGKRGIKNIT